MTTDNISINFKCPKCGCTEITLPDNHTDESHASYRQILVTAGPVRRRRLWADGRSAWR